MHNSQLAEVMTSSQSRAQAQLWMEKICGPHQLDTGLGQQQVDFRYQARRMPGMSCLFGEIAYGTAVSIGVDGHNGLQSYSISLPIQGEQSLVTPGCRTRSDQRHGLILSPETFQQLDMEKRCHKQQLVIPASAVRSVAEELIARPLLQAVRFEPSMDMDNPALQAWWQLVEQLMGQKDHIQALYGHSLLTRDLETSLIKGLLLAQPNSLSAHLQGPAPQSLPGYLQRACRFIKAHITDDISIDAICTHAGINRFTLFAAFRDHLQTTPMQWQRNLRLDQVREALLAAEPHQSVSAIALDSGFTHLSRFASQYRERFGERPSDTLACARTLQSADRHHPR